jgi:hypothetical protein
VEIVAARALAASRAPRPQFGRRRPGLAHLGGRAMATLPAGAPILNGTWIAARPARPQHERRARARVEAPNSSFTSIRTAWNTRRARPFDVLRSRARTRHHGRAAASARSRGANACPAIRAAIASAARRR